MTLAPNSLGRPRPSEPDGPSPYKGLFAPGLFASAGMAAHAAIGDFGPGLGLIPASAVAAVLHAVTGGAGWFGLAWFLSRLMGILLAAKPRLLSDLIGVGLFGAAAIVFTQFVLEWPATGLIATSSVMLAVLGFALRNIFSDVFAGIALGLEHPFGIGDWIEGAEGHVGRVVGMSWRATRLVRRDGAVVTVPNGQVAGNRLINYGSEAVGRYRTELSYALDAEVPVERAKRILLAAALDAGRNFPDLEPDVLLARCEDGAAIYIVRFHITDYATEPSCCDAVGAAVLHALNGIGLELNRPSRDVRLVRQARGALHPRREALMRTVELFRPFNDTERAYLARNMREAVFRPGEFVMRHGDTGRSIFVVGEGALDVLIPREDGEEVTVARLAHGAIFGEMSLVTGGPRSATVVAVTDAVVFELGRKELEPVLSRRPELMEALATIIAERQAENAERSRAPDLPPPPPPPTREVLLAKLRDFFDFEFEVMRGLSPHQVS